MIAQTQLQGFLRRHVVAAFVAGIGLLLVFSMVRGTLNGGPTPAPVAQPGSQAVYERIAADTDCTVLQGEFDQAYADHQTAPKGSNGATWTLAYMEAANARMKALGCP